MKKKILVESNSNKDFISQLMDLIKKDLETTKMLSLKYLTKTYSDKLRLSIKPADIEEAIHRLRRQGVPIVYDGMPSYEGDRIYLARHKSDIEKSIFLLKRRLNKIQRSRTVLKALVKRHEN